MSISATLLTVCCCLSLSAAASVQPSFNPKDIVNRVRSAHPILGGHGPSISDLDDGEFLIDTSGALAPAPGAQEFPAVAFDGTNYLVVWQDCRSGSSYDIYGARVTPSGVVLDPTGIDISTAPESQEAPSVAFGGGVFLVAWNDAYSRVLGARVTPAGEVVDPAGIPIATWGYPGFPAVAFGGDNFLVAYVDSRGGSDADIYATRVTPEGEVLDPNGFTVSTAANDQIRPAAAFDGSNFLVVWFDNRSGKDFDIYGARVSPARSLLDSTGIPIHVGSGSQYLPYVAFGDSAYLVVWQENYNEVWGARVTPAGEVLDRSGIAISTTGYDESRTAVAFDGGNFLVAWADSRNPLDVYGARVTPGGVVLDSAGLPISTAEHFQAVPAIAFGGSGCLVVWLDGRSASSCDIYGARVTAGGAVLDTNGLAISTTAYGQETPAVAYDGTNYLVAWADGRAGGASDIYGARVTSAGTVLDPSGIAISTGESYEGEPAVAFDGANYLVVWDDRRSGRLPDVYGARVTPEGVLLDSAGIPISVDTSAQWSVDLASDGHNFLVVWCDSRNGEYEYGKYDIYGARVTSTGEVLDTTGFPISVEAEPKHSPTLAFDGQNFLVAWSDQRGGGGHDDIYGARVTLEGVVLDTAGIAISTATEEQRFADLAFDGENFLVVWEIYYGGVYAARVSPAGVLLDTTGITISTAAVGDMLPVVAFDGEHSLVVWQDTRGGTDLHLNGARVRPDGTVFDRGSLTDQQGSQSSPALARGPGSQMFLAYQGWAGTLGGKTYNADRVWGMMDPNPGIEESPGPQATSHKLEPTIIRGVLFLPSASGVRHEASSVLLDISGRKVLDLHPGANDVHALAPGVYFVRAAQAQAQAVRKVVVTE